MTLKIWNDVPTSLDLNGPILSIVTDTFAHSVGDTGTARTSVCASEFVPGSGTKTIAFTGVATATFPAGSPSDNDGTITHQWYKITTGGTEVKLGPSTTYNGETSSTLNLTHLKSPDQNGEQYFVEFGYDPSGYGAVGAAKSVPNAINEPIRSTPVSLTVLPTLSIDTGVSTSIVTAGSDATFTVLAGMDENNEAADAAVTYQWYVGGEAVTDGVRETTSTANQVTHTFDASTSAQTLVIPEDATNVRIRVSGGAGGNGGSDVNGSGGSAGSGRSGLFSIADGGRTLTINVGTRGSIGANGVSGTGGGNAGSGGPIGAGRGGNAGSSGSSGGGGGGADGVYIQDSISGTYVIAAGGGGGGGGGGLNRDGTGGTNAGAFESISGGLSGFNGPSNGGDRGGANGGGGGGAGNGYRSGTGGAPGTDNPPPAPPQPPRPPVIVNPPQDNPNPEPPVVVQDPIRTNRRSNRRQNRRNGRRRRRRRRRGGGCFTENTSVMMQSPWTFKGDGSDSYELPISEVKVGDHVLNVDKTKSNEVVFIEKHNKSNTWTLYSPDNEVKPFATSNHMLFKDGKWVVVENDLYPWLDKCEKLENAIIEEIQGEDVYNLWVTGDGTYNVNGYGTHSIMFDGGFMRNAHDQKVIKYEDVLKLMHEFTSEKSEILHGAYLINKIFGKVNFPITNKLFAYILLADDDTLRKKFVLVLMKVLTKIGGLLK